MNIRSIVSSSCQHALLGACISYWNGLSYVSCPLYFAISAVAVRVLTHYIQESHREGYTTGTFRIRPDDQERAAVVAVSLVCLGSLQAMGAAGLFYTVNMTQYFGLIILKIVPNIRPFLHVRECRPYLINEGFA